MAKFVALITGAGEGCDYSLGCNIRWKIGEAGNKEEFAEHILREHGMMHYDSYLDIPIEKLQIFEVNSEELVLYDLDRSYEAEYRKHQKNKKEAEEQAEYERLKAKYEK